MREAAWQPPKKHFSREKGRVELMKIPGLAELST